MFGDQTTTLIACAIVRRNGEILLVRQRDKDGTTNWALPGGAAESAEGLFETLAREVREETGLNVLEAGPIAYAAQLLQPRAIAFVFEVLRWSGDLLPADPDDDILEAAFMPVTDALERLYAQSSHFVRTPLLSYLRGTVRSGTLLSFRRDGSTDTRVHHVRGPEGCDGRLT